MKFSASIVMAIGLLMLSACSKETNSPDQSPNSQGNNSQDRDQQAPAANPLALHAFSYSHRIALGQRDEKIVASLEIDKNARANYHFRSCYDDTAPCDGSGEVRLKLICLGEPECALVAMISDGSMLYVRNAVIGRTELESNRERIEFLDPALNQLTYANIMRLFPRGIRVHIQAVELNGNKSHGHITRLR